MKPGCCWKTGKTRCKLRITFGAMGLDEVRRKWTWKSLSVEPDRDELADREGGMKVRFLLRRFHADSIGWVGDSRLLARRGAG